MLAEDAELPCPEDDPLSSLRLSCDSRAARRGSVTTFWAVDECIAGDCAGSTGGRDEGSGVVEAVARVDADDEADVDGGIGFEPVSFAATARARAA